MVTLDPIRFCGEEWRILLPIRRASHLPTVVHLCRREEDYAQGWDLLSEGRMVIFQVINVRAVGYDSTLTHWKSVEPVVFPVVLEFLADASADKNLSVRRIDGDIGLIEKPVN